MTTLSADELAVARHLQLDHPQEVQAVMAEQLRSLGYPVPATPAAVLKSFRAHVCPAGTPPQAPPSPPPGGPTSPPPVPLPVATATRPDADTDSVHGDAVLAVPATQRAPPRAPSPLPPTARPPAPASVPTAWRRTRDARARFEHLQAEAHARALAAPSRRIAQELDRAVDALVLTPPPSPRTRLPRGPSR